MSRLFYTKPAGIWEEAIPIGNGRLGAMIFGGVKVERLQVNEETMWYGGEVNRLNPDARPNLEKVRSLLVEGKIGEAQSLMSMAFTGCPNSAHPYQTLGDVYFYFDGEEQVDKYERGLDLDTAVSFVQYQDGDTVFRREYFASNPGESIILHFTAKGSKTLNFTIQMGREKYFDGVEKQDQNGVCLYGNLGQGGSRFAMMMKAGNTDGQVSQMGEYLKIQDAKEVTLVFGAKTSFWDKGLEIADLRNLIKDTLEQGLSKGVENAKTAHVADYQSLYKRVELSLEKDEAKEVLPTDIRLEQVATKGCDLGLEELLFDYGRYLLISCSRQGNLPANLQGIWNKDFMPPWDSKYTININAEMNYWPAEYCNLPECHEPLFDLLERVRVHGHRTAKEMYGCRGSLAHHNTDIHGDSAPQDLWLPATFWTQGEAWLATHIWTHYSYTGDLEFLQKAFPILVDCSLFYVDFLTEYKGYLVTNPSVSPENTYILPNGEKGCACIGPTMDNQILRDLFTMCLDSYELLKDQTTYLPEGVESLADLMEEIRGIRERLAPTKIGSDGRIMEWLEEYEEEEPGHRHISHLYGLYPSNQISVTGTPELAEAAKKTLEHRLSFGGGHTGWSRAWIMNHYAKLWDGEKAHENIEKMLIQSTYPNMFDKHPPFQIDGNFGACAAIAQMLVQSTDIEIFLLPALPVAWDKGSVKGLKVIGNATVDLSWEQGKVKTCSVHALADLEKMVVYKGIATKIKLKAGQTWIL